jgi:hypothetical protein
LGKVLGGAVFVRGVVLSGGTDDHTGPESHHDAAIEFPVGGVVGLASEFHDHLGGEHVHGGDNSDSHKEGGDNELVEKLVVNLVLEFGKELANERDKDSNGSDNKGEVDGVRGGEHGHAGGGDDKGSAGRFSERSEKIGSHSSDITNVITDVIGNCSGVVRRVFLEAVGDLSSEIGTDISSLGVNTTTDSSEESDGRATETISGDVLEKNSNLVLNSHVSSFISSLVLFDDNGRLVREDEDLKDDEGKSDEHETEDLTTSEGSIESSVDTLRGTEEGSFDVALSGDLHSDESTDHGGNGSNDESEGGEREPHNLSSLVGSPGHVDGTHEDDTEDGAENSEVSVFFFQESVGTILNGLVDLKHPLDTGFIGPGEVFFGLFVVFFTRRVDNVVLGLEDDVDFVDLQNLEDTPDHAENTSSEDDVMGVSALDSCGCCKSYCLSHSDYPYFSFV